MLVQPYLSFEGRCEEAIAFYKKAAGAEVKALMRWKDMPASEPSAQEGCAADGAGPSLPPGSEEKIMHSEIQIGDSVVMMSDGMCQGAAAAKFAGVSLTLSLDGEADAKRIFSALAEGGQVTMPQSKTFFSPLFGSLTDRFGVAWIVIVN